MANLIREQRIIDSNKRTLVKYVIVSDGTQQANTTLLDVSTLAFALNANGYIMTSNTHPKTTYRTTISRIFGNTKANNAAFRLQWHGAANSEIVTFGNGQFEYNFEVMGSGGVLTNPEASSIGDVLISTTGLQSNDVATIFLDVRKDARDYDAGQTADRYAFNV